jgi:hypothetical protein
MQTFTHGLNPAPRPLHAFAQVPNFAFPFFMVASFYQIIPGAPRLPLGALDAGPFAGLCALDTVTLFSLRHCSTPFFQK